MLKGQDQRGSREQIKTTSTMRITFTMEEEVGFSRSGWLGAGERDGDEAWPAVDHRDLGVDMETAAVRPPVGTDRVSENFCCFYLLYSSVRRHRGHHRNPVFCMYVNVCQKMSKDCLCLFTKQIQMYVVVGLQFWCHGLYCLSLCGG